MTHHTGHSPEMRECIDNCGNCHEICLDTSMQCLETGGKHAEAGHIRVLRECAEICQTSAYFMLIRSEFHPDICAMCATICEKCAQACERFGEDFMKACAQACRKCADSCRRMSGQRKAA